MKRTVRIKLDFEIVLDDDRDTLPFVKDPCDVILHGVKSIPGLVEIKPGAKYDIGFTRESWTEIRRRDRIRRANTR